jgi:spermidine synthase
LTPSDRLARLLLTTRGGGALIFYHESRGATVAVAGAVLHYPQLERRVCVELLPSVVEAGEFFPENYKAWSDARMQIRVSDGRQELLWRSDRYDLITLEPPPPSAEGVVNLYSTEFYRLASRRLEQNGLFAQWLPISTQNDEETRSLVRSFLDVFPYATLWTTEMHEMLMIGRTRRGPNHQPLRANRSQYSTAGCRHIFTGCFIGNLDYWQRGTRTIRSKCTPRNG